MMACKEEKAMMHDAPSIIHKILGNGLPDLA